jgi:hypothetical protein
MSKRKRRSKYFTPPLNILASGYLTLLLILLIA